ncbi:MAG: hypothetical protein V2G40_01910 [bacterium JZ-2024 1]
MDYALQITQHKRVVHYRTHPNPDSIGTSFIRKPLYETAEYEVFS